MFDMKKQLMWSKLKVGLVITAALVTLLMAVFFAGGLSELMSPQIELKAQIPDVKGLRVGAPVWVSGIEVGTVKNIALHLGYGTIATLSINKSVQKFIRKDSTASVLTAGLLGDKYVDISPGTSDAELVRSGDMILGSAQIELKDVIQTSNTSIRKMTDFVAKLEFFISKVEKGYGTVARLFTDPSLYNNFNETFKSVSVIMHDIKNQEGTLGLLIKDPSLYNKLITVTSAMENLSIKLTEGSEKLTATASSMEEFSRNLNNPSGTLNMLAKDPELYQNFNKASRQLSLILERVDKGEGAAGALINDRELAAELKQIITELKAITSDIKANPGKYFKFSVF